MTNEVKETKFFELILALFFCCFSSFMLYTAFKSQKSLNQMVKVIKAMTMPKIILTIMLAISLYVLGVTVFWYIKNRDVGNIWPDFLHLFTKKTVFTFVLVVLYACSWKYLGFSISTFLYFTAQSKLIKPGRTIRKTLLISGIFTAAAYLLFSVGFHMFFPEPILDLILYS